MKVIWLITAVVVSIFGAWFGFWRFPAAAFVDDVPAAATKVLGSLLVITLLVERSLAAINAAVHEPAKKKEIAKLRDLEVGVELNAIGAPDARNQASNIREKIVEIDGKEQQLRIAIGFILAILVSAAGVRTLSALIKVDVPGDIAEVTQKNLAHLIDIILTAGLITGGSDGLAQLVQTITKRMNPTPKML